MSEFNGKKYYGFSLHNDPALLTTTRNFEFRYTRPENLERVIQKVQLSDGAEAKQKKLLLAKYCKLKKRELSTPFQTRDVDVETHVSRNELKKVRELSENEIDQLIGRAKSTISMVVDESAGGYGGECGDGGNDADDGAAAVGDAANKTLMEGQKRSEQNVSLDPASPKTSKSSAGVQTTVEKKKSGQVDTVIIEEIRNPQPKWVEIEEAPRFEHLTVAELKLPHRIFRRETKTLSLPTVPWQQMQQTQQQQEALQPQKQTLLTQSQTQTSLTNHLNQQTVTYDEVTPSSYYVEDSDYEYEMLKRPGYTKYCEKRPALDEMTNVSNESGGVPRFIEIEPHIPCMDLSFLKNANPIRYTDLTDEIQEEERVENQEMKVYIKGLKQVEPTTNDTKATEKSTKTKKQPNDKKHDATKRKFFGSKSTSKPTTPITAVTLKSPQTSPRSKNVKNTKQHEHSPQHSPKSFTKSPKSLTPRTPKMKNIFLTRSIEELKVEKVSLFNKMNATQERIIEILDKLRMNLLEIYVPDSTYDKSRRQKNAFEFSVRFSRNFLYPLKGMVEDLRTTTKEAFNSTTSNEACNRVANIYALILQSLQTYQRQLRFFSLDQVPQKLTALIDMIHVTTNLCLDKSIFAANDPIIDCLLERCTKFVGFLEDLHEERFVTARDASGKPCSDKSPTKHAAVHAKYDLKMFMNDLNMYEPKLVPKRLPAHSRYRNKTAANAGTSSNNTTARRRIRKIRKQVEEEKNTDCPENSSQMVLTKATEDAITTQIQNYDYEGSSGLLASMQNMVAVSNELGLDKNKSEAGGNPLNQAVIEALQMVTKEQVRQVLEPIIQTLGSALDKKNNSETIEAILKALNTKIFSTTGDENKKRHDSRNNRMRSKVPDTRAADSANLILSASTASKAVKHTKKRAEKQKHTNTTSRSSSKNNKNNNSNKNNEMYSNVIELDGGDAGDAGNDANDSYSESNNEEEEEWESLNDDNNEELDIEKEFAVQVRSSNKQQQQQQLKQQRQQEEASQQQKKQSKQQKPKTKQEQRTQQFLQRKKLQEQQLLQQQQQLKELHALQQQLRQKQIAQKMSMHRKHSVKHQNKQQQQLQQQQELQQQQHNTRVQHKSQDRLQQQRSGPQTHQQVQRKISQRQVKEKLQTSERERQEKLPLQQSLRQLRRPSGHLNPAVAVSNPLTARKYSNSSTGTPMSAATPTAHSEVGISQRPQKQQQQQEQQQHQDQEQQNSYRRPAPCHKNKARLFKKRRNPLRSPPPAPAATPLTSARSRHSQQFEQTSDLEATEDEIDVSVEELPHAMTNLSNNSSSYNRECNKYYNNYKYQNQNNSNNTGDSETITSRRHEVPPTAASIGDCSAAAVSAAAGQQNNRSFELNPHEAAAAASAIAVALDTISVGEKTNVLNLLQTRVISDVLVKCLVGANPVAVSSTQKSEDDFNDDDDDNEFDDDDDYDGEEEDNDEAGYDNKNKNSTNGKANVAASAARGNDDGSSDTESREVVEVASYVSTSKKRRGRKTLEQLVRQNYQEQLNAMYAKSPAFPIQQQQLHMQLLQQQQQQEPESQQELHLKLLQQQEQQKEPRSQQDLHAQYMQEQTEPQNQKQLHMQQLSLEQSMLLQPERTQQNQQQHQSQQQRRPLNEINYLHAHPSKTNNKENDLSQVFMEVMERNKQQQTVNRQKGDLHIDNLLNTRDQFLGLCKKNRFYSNPNYTEPWKVFSRLSAKLASEIVSSVEEDFSIGVSKFVQDFLELETHT